MSEPFKLKKEEFSKIDNEWQWTYGWLLEFIFNGKPITKITITDHYQQKHSEITNELILNIFYQKLNGLEMKPFKKHDKREVFIWDWASYQGKAYHLTFWFENNNSDWLWVRNCYPIS